MTLFLLPALLMLAGALALLYFPWQGETAADRDSLNRTLYQTRLDELAQEDNVVDREAMVVELQRTLLADIPDATPAKVRPLGRWVLLPGAVALVLLSCGIFLKTSDIGQVLLWQQAERQTPALLRQLQDPTAPPLRMDQLAQLRLGLRSQLQDQPDYLAGWQLLGRIALLLNDGETAIGAFARAHQLAAHDPVATFDYASVLVRAGDSGQLRMAELLLRELHQRQPQNLPVLELLALSALRSENYPQAVAALQQLLEILPANDARRQAIERQLAQAQAQASAR
jgi:cytochrome c-type biogenesis protein CcmI